jgi:hypothetical protein
MSKRLKIFSLILAFVAITSLTTASSSSRTVLIKAKLTTGGNRFLGRPLHDFGPPFGTGGSANVGAWNPSGAQPLPLTPDSPESTVLATFVDPGFLARLGKTINDVPADLLNVPLRDVKANVDFNGVRREAPIPITLAEQLQPSQASPADPVTLGQWMRAEGFAHISCRGDVANVRLDLKGLIPNRVYSAWGVFGGQGITPFPLGGAPNVMVTDDRGNATYKRELNFCPFDLKPGQVSLLAIDIVFHSDHQNHGLVPELDLAGFFNGTTTHTQLEFLVTGVDLQ